LLALAASGCQPGTTPAERTPTPYVFVISDDAQFIDMMTEHHQLAIDMARLALLHAEHEELKGLARDIIQSQEEEITRMSIWRGRIAGGATPAPWHISGVEGQSEHGGMHGMPGMDVDLESLAKSNDFDREFIEAMIPHHESAIAMSQAALPNLKLPELRDLARDIVSFQQIEIDRMERWRGEWFE
jgi:uncharacterized protein (DUF305 family)